MRQANMSITADGVNLPSYRDITEMRRLPLLLLPQNTPALFA
jgi:hypothetical protein